MPAPSLPTEDTEPIYPEKISACIPQLRKLLWNYFYRWVLDYGGSDWQFLLRSANLSAGQRRAWVEVLRRAKRIRITWRKIVQRGSSSFWSEHVHSAHVQSRANQLIHILIVVVGLRPSNHTNNYPPSQKRGVRAAVYYG